MASLRTFSSPFFPSSFFSFLFLSFFPCVICRTCDRYKKGNVLDDWEEDFLWIYHFSAFVLYVQYMYVHVELKKYWTNVQKGKSYDFCSQGKKTTFYCFMNLCKLGDKMLQFCIDSKWKYFTAFLIFFPLKFIWFCLYKIIYM